MEAFSLSETKNEEALELEDAVSDLHALKSLYGLLQQSNARVPQGDERHDSLDEKSRLMLKRLLDGATQQVLQCQAKIVSRALDPPSPSEEPGGDPRTDPPLQGPQKGTWRSEKLQKCESLVQREKQASHTKPKDDTEDPPVVELEKVHKPCPDHERSELKRQRSGKSTKIPDTTSGPRIHHGRDPDRPSRLRTRGVRRGAQDPPATHGLPHSIVPNQNAAPPILGPTAAVPPVNQKRIRTGSSELPVDTMSRRFVMGRAEERPTQRKPSRRAKGAIDLRRSQIKPAASEKHAMQTHRTASRKIGRSGRTVFSARTVEDLPQTITTQEDRPRMFCKDRHKLILPEKPLSHHCDPSLRQTDKPRRLPSRVGQNDKVNQQGSRRQIGPYQAEHQPRIPRRSRLSSLSSSGSDTTPSCRSSSMTRSHGNSKWARSPRPDPESSLPRHMTNYRSVVPRGAVPRNRIPNKPITHRKNVGEKPTRRVLSHQWEVCPTRTSNVDKMGEHEKKQGEGRLRRFKNKLAVIFHHHHHHHHHLHSGPPKKTSKVGLVGDHQHRSLWEYIRRVIHHSNKKGVRKGVVPAQHGYLHAVLEGLLRHVWGTRQRKAAKAEARWRLGKKTASRSEGKKIRWWQWFQRRRGVKLACRKRSRLRLAFTGAHQQVCKGRKR